MVAQGLAASPNVVPGAASKGGAYLKAGSKDQAIHFIVCITYLNPGLGEGVYPCLECPPRSRCRGCRCPDTHRRKHGRLQNCRYQGFKLAAQRDP